MDDLPPIRKRQGRSLPHWTREGAPNYVTMRLGDALPAVLMQAYRDEIRERIALLERRLGRPADEWERADVRRRCAGRVERYLDAGHGECLLRLPEAARVVRDAIRWYADERYGLDAWCVVPNHAHLILTPCPGWDLEKILYDLKHASSRLVNQALGRRGSLWQNESFDHLVQNAESLERFRGYILRNPSEAGLRDWPFVGVG